MSTAPRGPTEFRCMATQPLARVERDYILTVLADNAGNRSKTARMLGIGANTLWRKLKRWGVPPARGTRNG